jgi:hypothetical protein
MTAPSPEPAPPAKPAPSPRSTQRAPSSRSARCNPPFEIDSYGVKRFKPECF